LTPEAFKRSAEVRHNRVVSERAARALGFSQSSKPTVQDRPPRRGAEPP